MKIYDISRELFSTPVYPGDPVPAVQEFLSTAKGSACNLSVLTMGTHNGTHMDAPWHFIPDGKQIHQLKPQQCVGECVLIELQGDVTVPILKEQLPDACEKLLIRGDIHITTEAAQYLGASQVHLLGVEGCTTGNEENGVAVHQALLGSGMVILENLDLSAVRAGTYLLSAMPLNIAGLDGSPCRPVLMEQAE